MTINDATPEEWDAVSRGDTKKEGFPEQERIQTGYWGRRWDDQLGSKKYPHSRFKKDTNGNLVYETDVVNNPEHYNQGGVECIDYIEQQLTPEQFQGYLSGNAIKYLHRYQYKNGVEDLKKHQWYVEKLIQAMS